MKKVKVIVLGLEGATSLGIIRSLKSSYVIGIDLSSNQKYALASYSRYLEDTYYFETLDDINKYLIDSKGSIRNTVIIPTSDSFSEFLLSNNILKEFYHLPSSRITNGKLFDKSYMKKIAQDCGFSIPREYSFDSLEEIEYPIIVKPKDSFSLGKDSFRIFHERHDLESWTRTGVDLKDYFVEEFITTDTQSMKEILGFRNENGYNSNLILIDKIRQSPPITGSSSFIKTVDTSLFNSIVRNFMDFIDYNGLFDIELIYSKGKYYYIETNFRAGAPIYISKSFGYNLPLKYIESCFSILLESEEIKFKPVYWMNVVMDLGNLKHNLSFKDFAHSIVKSNAFGIFSMKDPIPFCIYFFRRIVNKLS